MAMHDKFHGNEYDVISLSRVDMTYRGIKNPSSLCYLISAMQQLFMMPSFRDGILALALLPAGNGNVQLQSRHKFLVELKSLFICLENGRVDADKVIERVKTEKHTLSVCFSSLNDDIESTDTDKNISIDPLSLCATILDPNGEDEDGQIGYLNPEIQMDVSDFLSSFLCQLSSSLKTLYPPSNCPLHPSNCPLLEVRNTICGEICNQLNVLEDVSENEQQVGADGRSVKSMINKSNSDRIVKSKEQFYFLSLNMGAACEAPSTPFFDRKSAPSSRKYIGTVENRMISMVNLVKL